MWVDPQSGGTIRETSDVYFAGNKDKFDDMLVIIGFSDTQSHSHGLSRLFFIISNVIFGFEDI